ncbi:MAG: hypothetical protein ACOX6T_26470 [Myxococcales bacterium]|jgi:hypothetical protein
MALPTSPTIRRSIEDLHWRSLTAQEKLVVASLLERSNGGTAHLEMIAADLRDDALHGPTMPLVLTPLQNRAVASALERAAEEAERLAEAWTDSPAIARTGHYVAGYLRSLIDRLVKGAAADPAASYARIAQLLRVERPDASSAQPLAAGMVERTCQRLEVFGLGTALWPVIEAYAAQAAQAAMSAPSREEDDCDFVIVDVLEERRELARAAFDAALGALWDDEAGWADFLSALKAGAVAGCEAAPELDGVAADAAHAAYAIATSLRAHLREMRDSPWEAVSPGLKAILDRHPALKGIPRLQEFLRHEVRKQLASPTG